MEFFIRTITVITSLVFLAALNIVISYILPYPWSKINIIFLILIIIMMWRDSGLTVWINFFSYFIIELYSVTPFGILLFSSTLGILLIFWFYKIFFTNRSWYSAMVLSGFAIFFYRLIYTISLILLNLFGFIEMVPWELLVVTFLWEFIFTVPTTGVVYFILSKLFKTLKSSSLEQGLFRV
ncbi:MAG: hypothetical protein ABIJ23_03885 [Candidatus Magasanikbacteria bacterium]